MIKVIKRSGEKVSFEKEKIEAAIKKAYKEIRKNENYPSYCSSIAQEIENSLKPDYEEVEVEEIQDLVEEQLMDYDKWVAKAYIKYRYKRGVMRGCSTEFIRSISEKLNASSVQNQNANVDEASFGGRIGEASNEMMKQYALDFCLSPMARKNHLENRIYIHDLSAYAVGSHNCFVRNTPFITSKGIKTFEDFCEDDIVTVLSPNGTWVPAVVKKYGTQKINTYVLKRNITEVNVKATPNHRWINIQGDFQEGLKTGDKLLDAPYFWNDFNFEDLTDDAKKYWCYGFIMGDGTLETRFSKKEKKYIKTEKTKVKLCGEKSKYLTYFQECGWGKECKVKEPEVTGIPFNKTFPNFETLPIEYLIAFIHGLYEADGTKALSPNTGKQIYSIQFSSEEYCNFVEKYFEVAGLYINSIRDKTGQKTNFGTRGFTKDYSFTAEPSKKFHWYVKEIIETNEEQEVWCLNVDEGNAFVLANGIPTGNCLSIPFDDLLSKGFNTRQVDIRPANSINTAFQLVAVIFQLQSLQQFGGVSATHLDWTMVPYVRKSFFKHYKDGVKYLEDRELDYSFHDSLSIEEEDYKIYSLKAYKYAMEQTEKELQQAAEGLFHNLNSLQSRSGNQLPFTSINFGSCTLPEGRMVIKALLEGSIKGVGKHHRTSVFPCSIFQLGKGINREPSDPNYDLYKLALRSTAQRLYPNYANLDWSGNAGYDPNDPRTIFSTMG